MGKDGNIRWDSLLSPWGRDLLGKLGYSYLPTDHNPVTEALKRPDFCEHYGVSLNGKRASMSRVATLAQMAYFDAHQGPDGDDRCKALRRHWYAWYKSQFAQRLADLLGDYETNESGVRVYNDLGWSQRLSQTYAEFVDSRRVTYRDLWVEDASRMMERFGYGRLFGGCYIAVCLEKDSLLADFTGAAQRIGASVVYSGKGKSSKAAIEKMLRDTFSWGQGWQTFSQSRPLIVLHVSDHDFDGEAVIGPTFGQQAKRYTPWVYEARIGVKPSQVKEVKGDWGEDVRYAVKVSNSGYKRWAREKAIFVARCEDCGNQYTVMGDDPYDEGNLCPVCNGYMDGVEIGVDTAYGFEVESLQTRQYSGMFVDALLEVLPFDYIVRRLRGETHADEWQASNSVRDDILESNESYQGLLKRFEELEEIKERFENMVLNGLMKISAPHRDDWQQEEDDPTKEDFRNHLRNDQVTSPWRPFSSSWQTGKLEEWIREKKDNVVKAFERFDIGRWM